MKNKTVCVVGLGYIGLPTAALLASAGYEVVGVDVSEHAVNTINQGKIHIVEPDLDAVVQATVTGGRLSPRRRDCRVGQAQAVLRSAGDQASAERRSYRFLWYPAPGEKTGDRRLRRNWLPPRTLNHENRAA